MTSTTTPRRTRVPAEVTALREALAPYLDVAKLRRLIVAGRDPRLAYTAESIPKEVQALIDVLSALLRPLPGERIGSPEDLAAVLMVEMGHLDHEQLRVVCLDSRHRIQKIHTVYVGTLNTTSVRSGEIFKEALKLNSAAIVVAHNHPSNDVTPSPDDVMFTRRIIAIGELMDVHVLDHLVIGRGRFVSMREKGLAFEPT
ncbi:MAG TPA: JAB domain-containing protein [Roseiflexaceae bacterium]|nr:JAB domain-containing protein [Roseiflexaceae bacterium]